MTFDEYSQFILRNEIAYFYKALFYFPINLRFYAHKKYF